MVKADFKGPPDFAAWHTCFMVYAVAMIMLDQVLPPWFTSYIKIISDYHSLYGARIWAFLYQTEVRYRSEHMPFMAIRESDKLEAALARQSTTEYDPAKPWDHIWRMAADASDNQESRWWYREFERKIPILLEQGVGVFIGGDARVASSPSGHFATTHNATNIIDKERPDTTYGTVGGGGGGKKTKRSGGGGGGGGNPVVPPPTPADHAPRSGGGGGGGGKPTSRQHTHTKKTGEQLCSAFNAGNCGPTHGSGSYGGSCPSDSTKRHLCHWCLGAHSAVRCDPTGAHKTKQGGSGDNTGRKGSGGKGKGGKGKGK